MASVSAKRTRTSVTNGYDDRSASGLPSPSLTGPPCEEVAPSTPDGHDQGVDRPAGTLGRVDAAVDVLGPGNLELARPCRRFARLVEDRGVLWPAHAAGQVGPGVTDQQEGAARDQRG